MTAIETARAELEAKTGTEIGVSDWITVDQKMIDAFADVTHDHQWIHIDPARAAAETPFGGTIAHGFLTLSLASKFSYECMQAMPGQVMGINYGFNKLRFLTPVPAGSRLRGRFTLTAIRQRSDTELLRETQLTIEIEGRDSPALVAEWLGLSVFEAEGG
ncbi:MaoC family dehydratase [Antarcticimicrobium luteum]|uniref:MaoC family dehydratase n=1 Tax=Antarcticimicrobium luteum TaxID=2547397 RepID=A0A4V3AR39_9RHOB|nr:MaoC family dehydratase [Antarcticimicrobium luteum]TDK45117.1 MaoC family dehydratase [Antarcticimicrobium luteum]